MERVRRGNRGQAYTSVASPRIAVDRIGIADAENAVGTAPDGQFLPRAVSDGKDGTVVVWEDYRTGQDWDVYEQRVDSTGEPVWTADGTAICRASQNQRRLMGSLFFRLLLFRAILYSLPMKPAVFTSSGGTFFGTSRGIL